MLRAVASRTRSLAPRLARAFAAEAEAPKSGGGGKFILGLAGVGAGLYFAKEQGYLDQFLGMPSIGSFAAKPDYDAVRKAVSELMENTPEDYDDGSYGPLLVRLAWHASGTYDKNTGTGGSNGATMRFAPENNWGANAGLAIARDILEPVKKQFPWISYADLWTLAGAVAVEEMGGPHIAWRPGRNDVEESSLVALSDGRLPDGDKGAKHIRDIFYRMGFTDQEIVALSGAHTLGRCHPDRSGWDGPWTNAPTTFSNLYYQELVDNKWHKKKWNGPLQYEDKSGQLMMLPTDMALVSDRTFRKWVNAYAKDEDTFFKDFAAAFGKLLELGVPFPEPAAAASPVTKA